MTRRWRRSAVEFVAIGGDPAAGASGGERHERAPPGAPRRWWWWRRSAPRRRARARWSWRPRIPSPAQHACGSPESRCGRARRPRGRTVARRRLPSPSRKKLPIRMKLCSTALAASATSPARALGGEEAEGRDQRRGADHDVAVDRQHAHELAARSTSATSVEAACRSRKGRPLRADSDRFREQPARAAPAILPFEPEHHQHGPRHVDGVDDDLQRERGSGAGDPDQPAEQRNWRARRAPTRSARRKVGLGRRAHRLRCCPARRAAAATGTCSAMSSMPMAAPISSARSSIARSARSRAPAPAR